MAKPVSITLTGQKELDAKLKQLGTKGGNRVARNSLGAGARVVQKAIKKIAPKSIKDAIGMRNEKGRKSGKLETKVGVNVGKRSKTKAKRWAPVIVLGTAIRQRKMIGGKFSYITKPTDAQLTTGKIRENHIVSAGLSASQGSAKAAMKKSFDRSFAREVAKAKLKGK